MKKIKNILIILIMVVSLSPSLEQVIDTCFMMNSNIENTDDFLMNTSSEISMEEFISDIPQSLIEAQRKGEHTSAFLFYFPSKVYYSIWLPPDIDLTNA